MTLEQQDLPKKVGSSVSCMYFPLPPTASDCASPTMSTTPGGGEQSPSLPRYRKHKRKSGKYVEFSDERLRKIYGLKPLKPLTKSLPWAKSVPSHRKAGCEKSARPV